MTVIEKAVWKRRESRVSGDFAQLAERVRRRVPDLVTRGTTSANETKRLDVVRTFALPGRHDDALVLSSMFTFFGGSLNVHCDLMQEDGPIVRDLGSRDLGAHPSEEAIDAAVDSVVTFAGSCEEEIVARLDGQRRR